MSFFFYLYELYLCMQNLFVASIFLSAFTVSKTQNRAYYPTLFMSAGQTPWRSKARGSERYGQLKLGLICKGPLKVGPDWLQLFIFNRMLQLQKQFKINLLVKWSGTQVPSPAPTFFLPFSPVFLQFSSVFLQPFPRLSSPFLLTKPGCIWWSYCWGYYGWHRYCCIFDKCF